MLEESRQEDILLTGERLKMVLVGSMAIGTCVGTITMMMSGDISLDQFLGTAPLTAVASFFFFATINYLIGDWHRHVDK